MTDYRQRGLSKTASMPVMRAAPPLSSSQMPPSHHNHSSSRLSSRLSINMDSSSGGGLFSAWRNRSSKREQQAAAAATSSSLSILAAPGNDQLAGLDGKQLREAMWKHHKRHEQETQAATRLLRVIRYTPPRSGRGGGGTTTADDDTDAYTDDDAMSSNGGATPRRQPHHYDDANPNDRYNHRPSILQRGDAKTPQSAPYFHGDDEEEEEQENDGHGSSTTSRLSLTLSRLSFSASAHATIADYKAKKYDVEWKRDHDCTDCQVCHLAFTKWTRRRHHCRVCGQIVCDDCSRDQVHLVGKFARPKRSCSACFGLLYAMMHLVSDGSIQLFAEQEVGGKEWANLTPAAASAAATGATPRTARSGTITTTLAAPSSSELSSPPQQRFKDRLAEIQRVTAAGKRARRPGSDGRMCVVTTKWLRAWLAYTKAQGDSGDMHMGDQDESLAFYQHGAGTQGNGTPSSSSLLLQDRVPGAIDNLPLLMMKKGALVPRLGLVQCENNGFGGGSHSSTGDYQLIPIEVWDVFYRYYGGGPRIQVVESCHPKEPDQWVVDVACVLRCGRARADNPSAAPGAFTKPFTVDEKIIERTLTERHDPYNILVDVSEQGMATAYQQQRSEDPSPAMKQQFASSAVAGSSGRIPPPSPGGPVAFTRSVSDTLTTSSGYASSSRPGGVVKSATAAMSGGGSSARKPEPPRGVAAQFAKASSSSVAAASAKHNSDGHTTSGVIPRPIQRAPVEPPRTAPLTPHRQHHQHHHQQQHQREPEREVEPQANWGEGPPPAAKPGQITMGHGVYLPARRDDAVVAQNEEPSAARAASAFAIAMKEARLKQQRAIAGSSRGPVV